MDDFQPKEEPGEDALHQQLYVFYFIFQSFSLLAERGKVRKWAEKVLSYENI